MPDFAAVRPAVLPYLSLPHMNKLLGFLGMTIGGWLGWAAGAPFSVVLAFVLSMVGTGAGLYAGRRLAQEWF